MAADPITDPVGYAEEQVRAWHAALVGLQQAQEYTIGGVRNGRTLKRADLPEVIKTVEYWEAKLDGARQGNTGRARAYYVVTR